MSTIAAPAARLNKVDLGTIVLSGQYSAVVALTSATYWVSIIAGDQLAQIAKGSVFTLYCGTALTLVSKFYYQFRDWRATQSKEALWQLLMGIPSLAGSVAATVVTPIWGSGLVTWDVFWMVGVGLLFLITFPLRGGAISAVTWEVINTIARRGVPRIMAGISFVIFGVGMSPLSVTSGMILCLLMLTPAVARWRRAQNRHNLTVAMMELWGNSATYLVMTTCWVAAAVFST